MVEMMITVAIVTICLVMVLRVFSVCASAVSNMYNSACAISIIQEKLDELKLKAIIENGIETGSLLENITKEGKKFTFSQEINDWELPIEELLEEDEEEVEIEEEPDLELCEAQLIVGWGPDVKRKKFEIRTLFPISKKDL